MPTLNLGPVRFNARGVFDIEKDYTVLDTVSHNGASYFCRSNISGVYPNDVGAEQYWQLLIDLVDVASSEIDIDIGRLTVAGAINSRLPSYSPATFADEGTVDFSTALQTAVDTAISGKGSVYLDRDYEVSDNIANVHQIHFTGSGSITREGVTYYASQKTNEENVIYVSPTGLSSNDGLSPSYATNITTAVQILRSKGGILQNGIWRLQLLPGIYTENGRTLDGIPATRSRLRIWGADANGLIGNNSDLTTVPSVVWDGETSSAGYALRTGQDYPSGMKLYHLQNIAFHNWSGGAVLMSPNIDVVSENLHALNCYRGFWYQGGRFKHEYGIIDGSPTYGISGSYQCGGNIGAVNGKVSGKGVLFRNCATGVRAGRNSTVYVSGNTFENIGSNCVEGQYLSRVRTQDNDFTNAGATPVRLWGNGYWSGGGVNADIFPELADNNLQPFLTGSGSTISSLSTQGTKFLHAKSSGSPILLTMTDKTMLQGYAANPTWAPFRLPSYFLFNQFVELEVHVFLALNSGAGGTLYLTGQGTSTVVSLTIPPVTTYTQGFATLKLVPRNGGTSIRTEAEFKATGVYSVGTASKISTQLRANNEDTITWRLYWESDNADQVSISDMTSWVTY